MWSGQCVDWLFKKKYFTVLLWSNESDFSEGSPQSKPLSHGYWCYGWGDPSLVLVFFEALIWVLDGGIISALIVGSGLRFSFFFRLLRLKTKPKKPAAILSGQCVGWLFKKKYFTVLLWSNESDFSEGSPQSKHLSNGYRCYDSGDPSAIGLTSRWWGFALWLRVDVWTGVTIGVLIVGSGLRFSFFSGCFDWRLTQKNTP